MNGRVRCVSFRPSAAAVLAGLFLAPAASAADLKIALIAGKTGPLEAYAKQTEAGLMLGLEYLTKGTMTWRDRKIVVVTKDDQLKADLSKTLLEQAYNDDKVDIAVGTTSSAGALAMLPVAEENGKILIVEPAVADAITGDKWNRFIFRTARNSTQDAYAAAAAIPASGEVHLATLAQDYAFGKDGVAALKAALAQIRPNVKVAFEEYAPQNTTDFTASAQRLFDALKDKPGKKIISIIWAGQHPLPKIADLKPERYGIEIAPGGNILPAMQIYKNYPGMEGAVYYYYGFPKNPMNDWLVAEHHEALQLASGLLHGGRLRSGLCRSRGGREGRWNRSGEAHYGDGGPDLRHAEGPDDLPQGGSSGSPGHVPLQGQGRRQGRERSARPRRHDLGRQAADPGAQQALIRRRRVRCQSKRRRLRSKRAG